MKKYLITDPEYYTTSPVRFKKRLVRSIERHAPEMILFRQKIPTKYRALAKAAKSVARRYAKELYISGDTMMARRLGAHVHFTSSQLSELARYPKRDAIVSTHTFSELRTAKKLRAMYATFSPIFTTPGKGAPKGVHALRKALRYHRGVIALGGIVSPRHIHQIKKARPAAFASIRYFV